MLVCQNGPKTSLNQLSKAAVEQALRVLVCLKLFLCKKYFCSFGCFRIEGQKQQNSEFQSHFSMSKIDRILFILFFIEKYKKRRATFVIVIF